MLRGACLILVLFLGACSSTQFAYNRADWFVRWQIEKLVDLSADQQARLETHVDQLHDWHRRQELPRYHALILQLQATLNMAMQRGLRRPLARWGKESRRLSAWPWPNVSLRPSLARIWLTTTLMWSAVTAA